MCLLALCAVCLLVWWACPYARAAALLLSVVKVDDPSGIAAALRSEVTERTGEVALPTRSLRAHFYHPVGAHDPPVVALLHGVHHSGIDEPRFRRFARALAEVGMEVITPEFPELLQYRIEPQTITDIAHCGRALHKRYGKAPGAFAISFSGGLLMMAAAKDDDAFDYLVAIGAHHDLQRLSRYYAGQSITAPDGSTLTPRPDPYGARVIVRAHAERFFAADDVDTARRSIGLHLAERYTQARKLRQTMSPQGQARLAIVLDDAHKAQLSALLLAAVEEGLLELSAVSPKGSLSTLQTRTFLLHGKADPIVPSVETRWLEKELPAAALQRTLITPVLSHVDLSETLPALEYWRVVSFVAAILRQAE